MLSKRVSPATRVVAGSIAALAVLAGGVGLVTHVTRPDPIGAVSNIGTVTGTPPTGASVAPASPLVGAADSGSGPTLGTHSTKLSDSSPDGSAPVRLTISRLHVNVRPVPTALTSDNRSLDLPTSAQTVVWWAYGATPGSTSGTVLLAGHISWAGVAGRLSRIGSLRLGDRIVLTRQDGVVVRYAVVGRRRLPKKSLAELGLFTSTGAPRLVLVTCGGHYDARHHTYDDNVVVQAKPL